MPAARRYQLDTLIADVFLYGIPFVIGIVVAPLLLGVWDAAGLGPSTRIVFAALMVAGASVNIQWQNSTGGALYGHNWGWTILNLSLIFTGVCTVWRDLQT